MKSKTYLPGNKITCKRSLEYEDFIIPAGTYVIVNVIKAPSGRIDSIGIASKTAQSNWGSLNGEVPDYCGVWVHPDFLDRHFVLDRSGDKMIIRGEFIFKRKDLKGKPCKIVGTLPDSKIILVELQENVDGCSADGLGKAGHCILIPRKFLEKAK